MSFGSKAAAPFDYAASAAKVAGDELEGRATAGAADFDAAVARQNAEIAQQQGSAAAQAQERDATRKIGSMIANYGASGVQADGGSPADVLADSMRMATLDNITTRYNYNIKAQDYYNKAKILDFKSSTARTSAKIKMFTDTMSGFATVAKDSGNLLT